MFRNSRKNRTKAKALTSPDPRRVSLCSAGANQTPLAKFKSASVTVEKKELSEMITSMKAQGYALVSFAFKGEQWTREAVDAWLNDGGYEGYTVEGDTGDFTVKSDEAPEGDTREITTDDGVVVLLTKTPEEEAPAEDEAPAAEEAGSEVQPVATAEKAAPLSEERCKSLYTVSEFANLIRDLRWLVNDVSYDTVYGEGSTPDADREAVVAELKTAGQQLLNTFARLVNLEVDQMAEAFKSATGETAMNTEDNKTAETPAEKSEATVETPAVETAAEAPETAADEETPAEKTGDEAPAAEATDEQAPAWFGAFAASITKSVDTLTERVNAVETAQKADDGEGTEKSEEKSEVIPARKSEDASEEVNGTSASKAEKDATDRVESLRFKGALGF